MTLRKEISQRHVTRAVALTLALLLTGALAGCGRDGGTRSSAAGGTAGAASPEDRIVDGAEVTKGLADVRLLAAGAVAAASAGGDPAAGKVDAMYARWFEFEGAVRKNAKELYLAMEDGLSAIKNGVAKHDAARAAQGQADFEKAADAYLAGPGSEAAEGEGAGGGQGRPVPVALVDYAVEAPDAVPAGKVTFDVTNRVDQTHEFVVVKTDLAPDRLPVDQDGAVDERGAGLTFVDEVEDLTGGKTEPLTVDLAPGRYVLLCNLDDHYHRGMYRRFTVQ